MITKKAILKNNDGLHSRAAATFVQYTNRFSCEIFINIDTITIDAKSIMGIISLGLKDGTEFNLTFDGIDEEKAATSIMNVIEEEIPKL